MALPPQLQAQEGALNEFIDILNDHVTNSIKLGKYIEAEIARKRLDEIYAHEGARRREALRSRQLAESLGLEEAYMTEFTAFNGLWDSKAAAFERNASEALTVMRQRHAAGLRDFQQKLLARGQAPRHSKEYRDLRHVQETLAKAKHYEAAGAMKGKADDMMASEEEKWYSERQAEHLRKEQLFRDKLGVEVEALKRRMAGHRAELNRKRQGELEKLLQRYTNVKAQLEREHKGQAVELDKALAGEDLARKAEASKKSSAVRAR